MSSSKPELCEIERDAALVEDPHHDRLAVHRRHRRDAQVDLLALDAQPDAAVLRQPALGDVEVGHDLDPRDHRRRQPLRRRLDLVQHAVDPVADDQPVLERLDVDVRRARLERVGDEQDTRRITGASDARSFSCWTSASNASSSTRVSTSPISWLCADLPAAVQALERGVELRRNRDQRPHRAARDHFERADRVGVGGVGHRERQLRLVLAHRQRARLAQEARRHALLEDRKFGIAVGVHQRQRRVAATAPRRRRAARQARA